MSLNAFPSLPAFLLGKNKQNKHKQNKTRCGLCTENGELYCFAGISQVAVEINKAGLVKWRLVFCGEGKRGEKRISFSKN